MSKSIGCYLEIFSQVQYCRGYSGEEPPLPIPNREVKLTIADGTAPPGGRVGSCGSSKASDVKTPEAFLFRSFVTSFLRMTIVILSEAKNLIDKMKK